MPIFSPSILSADFVNLERDITDLASCGADWLHIDVMDGLFVPNITIGIPVVRSIRRVTKLPLDVHLMIDRPIRYVSQFVNAGADFVTIHLEADTLEHNLAALEEISSLGATPGISLKPGTPAEALKPYLDKCGLILVMTVEPGFGGQKFMADQLPKMRQIRSWIDDAQKPCLLSVDGGVDLTTAPLCREHGADVLIAGSACFRAPDRADFIRAIHAL